MEVGTVRNINELLNKEVVDVKLVRDNESDDDSITFYISDGTLVKMYHEQDCCEDVHINDINGDLGTLRGMIVMAEESINETELNDDTQTWTFYKLATINGYVTIRWFGESNGYYSERVTVEVIKESVD